MTTNFALSLSFDGIRLLQRVADGWHLVGEVGLDTEDLAADLADLRDKALLLEPNGLRTKLLIPDEQIKYLTLETAQTDLNDVMSALDGATPYEIKDLVVDFDRNGGRTFIAAVARETLEEAEAFAKTHKFAPVSFAAIPAPMTFQTEVFFGPTKMASSIVGGQIVRDSKAVKVTGVITIPEPEPEIDDVDAAIFTVRPKMATPESVAEPAHEKAITEDNKVAPETVKPDVVDPNPAVETKPAPVTAMKAPTIDAPRLAVPKGNPAGPAIGAADAPKIASPTINPVSIKKPAPANAPAVTGEPENAAPKPAPLAAPRATDMAAKGGFSSRREAPAVAPKPKEPAAVAKSAKEAKERKPAEIKRGKPRFLGLILTAILLIGMALVALWASTLTEEQVSSWFGYSNGNLVETAATAPPETDPTATQAAAAALQANDATATAAGDTQQATGETPLPQLRDTDTAQILSPAQADRLYAATGVWQRAPRLPLEPRTETLIAAIPSIEPTSLPVAQPKLPEIAPMSPDLSLLPPVNPPAPGTVYERDADGFVLATPEGTVTPSGAVVYAGKPPVIPPTRPATAAALSADPANANGVVVISGRPSKTPPLRPANAARPDGLQTEETTTGNDAVAGVRPTLRPEDLAPAEEETAIAADPALAGFRPKIRPANLAPAAVVVAEPEPDPAPEAPTTPDITAVVAAIAQAAPTSPFVNPSARAVAASRRPDPRPRNFDRVVARAASQQAQQAASASTAATAAAPTTNVSNSAVQPTGPVSGGVARAATLEGAIRLRDINLIGVYGQPNNRRALVRLGNGRYVKVEIGSSLDGGQVTAIGDNALNYVKRGKTYYLQLPSG